MLLEPLAIPLAAAVMNLIAGAGQAFPARPAPGEPEPLRTVEIRVYTLKDGVRERFHRAVERDVMPLLRQAKIDVIAYGPSAHDEVSYFLIRAFRDLDERAQLEDAFYGSKAWPLGPREAIISAIDHYSTAIVRLSEPTVRSLQSSLTGGNTSAVLEAAAQRASDVAALLARNETYVRAAEAGDVERFEQILADDFWASLPDGSHLNREAFLARLSSPATITDLRAHDVDVRVTGDFAIVHARTTFRTKDGRRGAGRYTDVWARRSGRWLCIAAHVTRYDPSNNR